MEAYDLLLFQSNNITYYHHKVVLDLLELNKNQNKLVFKTVFTPSERDNKES